MDSFQVKFEIWSKHGPDMAEKKPDMVLTTRYSIFIYLKSE